MGTAQDTRIGKCERCGLSIRQVHTGRQYEVAHIDELGDPMYYECTVPGPYEKYYKKDKTTVTNELDDLLGTPTKRQRTPTPQGELRPLSSSTKRGQVVEMLAGGATITKVCAAISIKRSCCLSHLSDARKFNGVQYETNGDKVKITLPVGVMVTEDASDLL